MGRGSNLFYGAVHKRASSPSAFAEFQLELLNLEQAFIGHRVTGQSGCFSGTRCWGARVKELPHTWQSNSGKASKAVYKEVAAVLDGVFEHYPDLEASPEAEFGNSLEEPNLRNVFSPAPAPKVARGYFGRVSIEQQRAVEALVAPETGKWVCYYLSPQFKLRKLVYLGADKRVLGWLSCR